MHVSPFRWHQLHATCLRRASWSEASIRSDLDWHALGQPHQCVCNTTAVRVQNHRPVVSSVDRGGHVMGVLFPGSLQSDFWDDGWESVVPSAHRQQLTDLGRASSLVRDLQIVTARQAVVTATGAVHCASRCRVGVRGLAECGLTLDPMILPKRRQQPHLCLGPLPHALVVRQRWAEAFSHIFFHLLPQLAVLLEHSIRHNLPTPAHVLLGSLQTFSSPSLVSILVEALGIQASHIHRSERGEAYYAAHATLLMTPPGTCANTATYGHSVLRRVHERLVPPSPAPRHLVLYFQRRCPMARCIVNEPAVIKAIERALAPPYQLKILNPGSAHTLHVDFEEGDRRGKSLDGLSYHELRRTMSSARIVIGACGSAWGNAFFAQAMAPDVHFIELNWLDGRASFVNMCVSFRFRFLPMRKHLSIPNARHYIWLLFLSLSLSLSLLCYRLEAGGRERVCVCHLWPQASLHRWEVTLLGAPSDRGAELWRRHRLTQPSRSWQVTAGKVTQRAV